MFHKGQSKAPQRPMNFPKMARPARVKANPSQNPQTPDFKSTTPLPTSGVLYLGWRGKGDSIVHVCVCALLTGCVSACR